MLEQEGRTTEEPLRNDMESFVLSAFSPEIKQGNAVLPSCSFSLNTLPQVSHKIEIATLCSDIYLLSLQVNLYSLKGWNELKVSVSQHMRRYKEEKGSNYDLDLSTNNLHYLVQLHRSFTFSK